MKFISKTFSKYLFQTIKRVVIWTNQTFVRTNRRILIENTRRNMEQENPYISNHLQKDTLDCGANIITKSLEYIIC